MYTIQYHSEDSLMQEIKSRLEDLSLAYKIEQLADHRSTSLIYSGTTWTEKESIFEHLNQTEEELKRWHYCNC